MTNKPSASILKVAQDWQTGTAKDTTKNWTEEGSWEQYADDQVMGTGQEPDTYAAGAPGIEDAKYWDNLSSVEKTVYAFLPRVPAWLDDRIPDALRTAWGPVGQALAPVLSGIGKALSWLDLGAEATERIAGLGEQWEYARESGTMRDFLSNIPAAWKAGTFAANFYNGKYSAFGTGDLSQFKPADGELPGVYGLVRARQMFAQGMSTEDVTAALEGDLGALAIRGQMQDLAWHMMIDPLNLVFGGVSKISAYGVKLRGSLLDLAGAPGRVAALGEAAVESQRLVGVATDAARTIEGLAGEEQAVSRIAALTRAGQAVTEKALLDAGVTSRALSALEEAGTVQRLANQGGARMFNVDKVIARSAEIADVRKVSEGLPSAQKAFEAQRAALVKANQMQELLTQSRLGSFGRKMLWAFGGDPLVDMTKSTFTLFAPGAKLLNPFTWFKLTPQSKMSEMLSNMSDTLGFLIKDMDVEDAHRVMANLSEAMLDPRLGTVLYSPEGRGVVLALQGFKASSDQIYAGWNASRKERELLERLSAALGKVDHDIVQAIKKGNVDAMLADLGRVASKPKTTAEFAIKAALERGEINKASLESIARMFFDGQVPYNRELYQLHMIGAAADFTKAQMMVQFGEQYAGLFEKATSALKAVETLAYLRLNPTYPIRNFLNNELTMWARGVWGTMSEKKILAYWGKMGIDPARLGQGMGPAELARAFAKGEAGKAAKAARFSISTAISDAEEAMAAARFGSGKGGIFDAVRRGVNNMNLGKADMGAWAAQIESHASQRAYTTAFIEGMDTYWKPGQYLSLDEYSKQFYPGVDLSTMPPAMRARVEGAMRSARYVSDLPEAVLGKMQVAVDDVLADAARAHGITQAELSEKMGTEFVHALSSELAAPLAKGDIHGVNRVLENTRIALQSQLDDWASKDTQAIIDNVAARVAATNDPTAFVRVYSESQDIAIESLESYVKNVAERSADIRRLPREAQGAAWDDFMSESDSFFGRTMQRDEARLEGLMRAGRGGGAPIPDDVMDPFRAFTKQTREFYTSKQAGLKGFFRKKFQSPEAQEAAWQKLMGQFDQGYAEMIDSQRKATRALDSALTRYVGHVNPDMVPQVKAWRGTVLELRMRYMADVKQAQRHIGTLSDPAEKAAAYQRMSTERLAYMDRLHRAEREGLEALENGRAFGTVRGMDPDTMAIYRSQLPEAVQTASKTVYDQVLKETGDRRLADHASSYVTMAYSRSGGAYVDQGLGALATPETRAASQTLMNLEAQAGKLDVGHVTQAAKEIAAPAPRAQWLQRAMDQFAEPADRLAVSKLINGTFDEMDDAGRLAHLETSDWFSIEPPTVPKPMGPDVTPDQMLAYAYARQVPREALEADIRAMGYDPILVEGVWDGVAGQKSYLVLGGRDTDAFYLGGKYKQEAVAIRDGLLATTDTAKARAGLLSPSHGIVELTPEAPNGMYMAGKNGRIGWRLDVDEGTWNTNWAPRLRPGRQGRVTLVRFGPPGATLLHPDDVAMRTGIPGAETAARQAQPIVDLVDNGPAKGFTRVYSVTDKNAIKPSMWASDNPAATLGRVQDFNPMARGTIRWADVPTDTVARQAHDAANAENVRRAGGKAVGDEVGAYDFSGSEIRWHSEDELLGGVPGSRRAAELAEGGKMRTRIAPRLNYYLENGPYEAAAAKGGFQEYKATVSADDLYDLSRDPEGILRSMTTPSWQQTGMGKVFIPGATMEQVETELSRRGYLGFVNARGDNPNGVAIFKPLAPTTDASKASYVGQNLNLPTVNRDYVVAALRQHFGADEKYANAVADFAETRAKVWASRTGQPKSAWYTRIKGIESGTAEDATKAASVTWDSEYRALITALNKPSAVSAIHEFGHVFRGDLAGPDLARVERWLGVRDGAWTVTHEEKFADGFVKWVREGVAPTRELVPAFDQFKMWLREVWEAMSGQGRDVKLSDEMRDVFRRLFDEQAPGYENVSPQPGIRASLFDRMVPEQPRIGEAADGLHFRDGGDIISKIRASAQDRINAPRDVEAAVPPDVQGMLRGYADYGVGKMRDAQAYSNNYAKIKRDSALLNYRARSHFDHALGQFVPFGFWTTSSMRNWFLWGVDKPKFLADFMRLRNFTQKNGANDYAPSRLQGMWPIGKMPFLPEWMGPLFIDPLRAALPFDIWSEPIDQAMQYGQDVNQQAENLLRTSLDKAIITQADYDEAIKLHSGSTWDAAVAEAKKTSQGSNPYEGLGMLLAPHAPIAWALKAAQGKTDEIGPFLPVTGTIKGISALLGVPGGVNIEGWIRKRLGLPEFDKWEDYRVDRMLSNMAGDGSASIDDVQKAMIDRSGATYQEAVRRAGIEYGVMKVTGSVGIPVKAWPEGEQQQRVLIDQMNAAYRAQDAGDKNAVGEFFDAHPEVKARLALFDTPQERLKTFLTDQVWSQWNAYSTLEQQAVKDALGDRFTEGFLNKDTRNYDSLDAPLLVTWLKLMGRDPGLVSVDSSNVQSGSSATSVKFPPEAVVKASLSFYEIRNRYYPWELISPLSTEYFKLTEGAERAAFVSRNPLLKRYWDWRREWLYNNPNVAPYIEEDPEKLPKYSARELERLSQAPMNLSPGEWKVTLGTPVFNMVLDYRRRGVALSDAAKSRLERMAEKYGMTVEQVIAQIQ